MLCESLGSLAVINIIKLSNEFRRFAGIYFVHLYYLQLSPGWGLDVNKGNDGYGRGSVIDRSMALCLPTFM
jgi:hypothetical protein